MKFSLSKSVGLKDWYYIHTNFNITPELLSLLKDTKGVIIQNPNEKYSLTCIKPELFTFEEVEGCISETINKYIQSNPELDENGNIKVAEVKKKKGFFSFFK